MTGPEAAVVIWLMLKAPFAVLDELARRERLRAEAEFPVIANIGGHRVRVTEETAQRFRANDG